MGNTIQSISQTIIIGKASTYLMSNDLSNGQFFGKRLPKPMTPILLQYVTDALSWQFQGNPSDPTLRGTANYAIWLYGIYGAQTIGNQGGGSVIPIEPITGVTYLIPITGANFTDSTHYDNPKIVGKNVAIFWNDVNRYLLSTEFTATSTGINILIPGFDAVANPTYELFIYIINP